MKYIKTFEEIDEINLKYDVGDYVILDVEKIKKNNDNYELNNGWRPKDPTDYIMQIKNFREFGDAQYYQVEFYFGYDADFYLIEDKDILRKATQKEIEEFELRKELIKDTDKYNI